MMRKIFDFIKIYPHNLIFTVALLCFATFSLHIYAALHGINIERALLHVFLSYADAFETAAMIIVMIALRDKR